MLHFNNDYCRTGHPRVIEALASTQGEGHVGYGHDDLCAQARADVRRVTGAPDAAVHFAVGGTQANALVIGALLRGFEGVVAAADGHISTHETGAIERGGHKVIEVACPGALLRADDVRRLAEEFEASPIPEHVVEPKLAYVSVPTEWGAMPRLSQLEELSRTAHRHGWMLFVDGARLGYGLGAADCDVTLPDIARLADAFTIGGTKCGALFGEAVVFPDPQTAPRFRATMKQGGGLLAKGWLLGAQFHELLRDGLYFEATAQAVRQAQRVRCALERAGVPLRADSPTNQQFALMTQEQADFLGRRVVFDSFERHADGRLTVRLCTSWATTDAEVSQLEEVLAALPPTR
ncbi:aminotransferase class I/II-fold pyridoxal phosphate-dependent enzyme [Berryella wangjianweii]|uniref:Aminotransferase class I/II-fold pyridoxal phosphate-dependent enzyme n=1 Tax=Berryella wangjianweii TaxID=2734634 RepID=A0A6M8JA03_9ACTN|nr:aminotransferase class I/II-fold pyridoxal phosphate-dependent enzyme [Berryella wangjianweii]QKF07652.1 aminotransferase class I/II-fold pyridoxal phosphate-dependent enzyme [Berryella wangjianweii]